MATVNPGKGKGKKQNKKTIPLSNFLAEDTAAPQGFNVVTTRKLDWAETMEDEGLDDTFTLNTQFKRTDNTKVLLPTAPKATRGPDIDLDKVPTQPPFKAYIGNLPYDVNQEDIIKYFSKMKVIDVQIPHNNGRQRGFAYAEFPDRQLLIDALALNGDTFRNRQLRIGLAGDNDNSRDNNRDDRREDRTANNWRSAPREDNFSRDTRDSRDNYGLRNGMNDYPERSMQRNRNDDYGRRPYDNDRGFRPNDRGFDMRSNSDRGYDRPSDRGFDRPSDRGFDRPNNRYQRYERNDSSDDYGYESHGRRFDDSRPSNRPYNDRRNDRNDSRRDYGFERRGREDSHYDTRDTSPPPSRQMEENKPIERPRLKLQPRSKPLTDDGSTAANSAIFGEAKPVNTALREQQIEEKLLKEKEQSGKKGETSDERIRRISSGSNHSTTSRSRKGSESGRDFEDEYRRSDSHRHPRSRKTSERSDKSASEGPKYLMTRNKESNNSSKFVSVRNEDRDQELRRGNGSNRPSNNNNNNNNRRRERERDLKSDPINKPPRTVQRSDDEEDRKGPAYTTSNKFAHLPTEDYEEDGSQNVSD